MAKNFQGTPSGHRGDRMWACAGIARQNYILACVSQDATPSVADWEAICRSASTHSAAIVGCYVLPCDLARYGKMDHLAPEPAKCAFVEYVRAQEQERAQAAFAPLAALGHSLARLDVAYGDVQAYLARHRTGAVQVFVL